MTANPLDRKNWFRIEEREQKKYPVKKLEIGSWINHTRTIVRCGYWLEPNDMVIEEALQEAELHLCHYMNEWFQEPSIAKWAWKPQPLRVSINRVDGPFSGDTTDILANVLGVDKEYLLRHLAYRIRGKWLAEQKLNVQPHPVYLRTFWYIEHPETSSQVYGIVSRKIGTHIPAGGTYNGEYEDYEPPAFDEWVSQSLYHTGYRDFCSRRNCMIYVHPEDVVWGKEI